MLKTRLMAHSRNKCIFAILLAVLVFFILPFLWLIKDEVPMMLVENPETCALCDGQPHDVPCLLGWTIATEQTDDSFDLTISPH